MNSLNKTARVIGVLILLTAVLGPFSMMVVPSSLIVPGDAAITANRIMASEGLFRASMASDTVIFLIEIVLCALLYVLLKPVNKTLSLVAAFSRLAMTVIQGINLLNHFIVLLLLSSGSYLAVFSPNQLHALVLLFLNAHEDVMLIWGLFFSFHLVVLGYLVAKSGYIPGFIGVLLVIAGLCYLIQGFGNILFPAHKEIFASIALLSIIELALPLWLLI